MKPIEMAARILLWSVVILTGIEIGGGIYEARVLVPLWASAPPGTVRAYGAVRSAYPSYAPDPRTQFWMYTTPTLGCLSLGLFLTSLGTSEPSRSFIMISSGMVFALVVSSYAFFVPTLARINVPTLPYEEVSRLVRLWVSLNWVRTALFLVAWLVALKVLVQNKSKEIT